MTIVASWMNKENINFPTLWTITDSRLSKILCGDTSPLLDCGAKLFSIRVVCMHPDQNGLFNKVYFSKTIGMAFAGSSLLALNLYAFLSHTLGNLINLHSAVPSMKNISDHVFAAFGEFLKNFRDTNSDSPPSCEISIFDYCCIAGQYQLFHIKYLNKETQMSIKQINLVDEDAIHLMGDRTEKIKQLIINYRLSLPKKEGNGWLRYPRIVIENLIQNDDYKTIGGEIQLGICNPSGFQIYYICRPVVIGQPKGTWMCQNIDLHSNPFLMAVGECLVGGVGTV